MVWDLFIRLANSVRVLANFRLGIMQRTKNNLRCPSALASSVGTRGQHRFHETTHFGTSAIEKLDRMFIESGSAATAWLSSNPATPLLLCPRDQVSDVASSRIQVSGRP
ncbi:hypothetical protein PG995_015677 [Apiospora arundinis]